MDLDAASPAPTQRGCPATLRRDPGLPPSAPADWQATWKNHWLCLRWKKPKANFKGFI